MLLKLVLSVMHLNNMLDFQSISFITNLETSVLYVVRDLSLAKDEVLCSDLKKSVTS